jgi:outer membrane protein assembly factor BamC
MLPMLLALGLSACSTVNEKLQGDTIDYKSTAKQTDTLQVPPDLSQLTRDSRYQPTSGSISASTLQGAVQVGTAAAGTVPIAPTAVGSVTLERLGNERWISSPQTPDQLWPQLQQFWQDRGFQLEIQQRETGWMETNWVENRAGVPQDLVRSTLGRLLGTLYDTGERDRFRTRVERNPDGRTDIFISHRGMVEVYTNERKDSTVWQPRPSDPDLEAVMLTRLMAQLGQKDEAAQALTASALAAAPETTARARMLGSAGAGLELYDGFDRAWRRVGLALDRSGFTVEDRDRSQGQYFVRYVDPAQTAKDEPGFFGKLFGATNKGPAPGTPARYRIALKGDANATVVTVLNSQGAPEVGDAAQRILDSLLIHLK